MNIHFKKRIAAAFIILMMFVSFGIAPNRVFAQYAVFDAAAFGQRGALAAKDTAITLGNWAEQLAKWTKDNWERVMRDVIAKRIIDYTVDETVKWVQGGGEPKFISDWNGFMRSASDIAFDSVIKEAGLSDLCEPFALQLRVALIPETRFNRERVDCTLSDIVANVQDFYDNFQNGGWLAYGESIKPENNLYMQLVMFDDEIAAQTAFNSDVKRQQSAAGQGFLSVSTCVEDDTAQLFSDCMSGGGGTSDECQAYAQQARTCTKELVQTPGSVVGKVVGEAVTSDKDWAANIQSWTSALVNAAINRLTREGLAAMTGSSSSAHSDYNPSASEYKSIQDAELEQDKKDFIRLVEHAASPYRKLLTEKHVAKGYTEQIIDLFTQINLMDANKVCVPQTTADEVVAQQTILAALTKRVNQLQPTVTEADAIIAQIRVMTGSIRDTAVIRAKVTSYMETYNTEKQIAINEELTNSTDRAVQLETLQNIQSRYTQCKQKIDLLKAQASSGV